jgi:hypothetical protein
MRISKAFLAPRSSRMVPPACLRLLHSPLSSSRSPVSPVTRASPADRDLSKATRHLSPITTPPTRKINTTVRRTALATPYHSPSSSILPSSRARRDRSLLLHLPASRHRALFSPSLRTAKVSTASSTPRAHTVTSTTNTATARV